MKSRTAPLWIAALALVAMPAFAKNVATVNGTPVPQSRVDMIVKQLVASGKKDTPNLRGRVMNEVVLREALVQEAKKKGFHKLASVKDEIAMMSQSILINALRQDFLKKHPVTDADIKAEYNRLVKEHENDKEYRVRHILLDKESEAKSIIAKLKGGESFGDHAKQSKDVGTAKKGGDLGWAAPDRYVPPFAQEVTSLKKGQISESPVKTRFGYHVVKVDDVRAVEMPALAQVKPQLHQNLQAKRLQEFQQKIIDKAKIKPVK